MIYTCTFNPSVDYQIQTESIEIGGLNRVEDTAFYPGGKGINVSRVLNNLNIDTVALGFVGGFTGEFLVETLNQLGIDTDFVQHEKPTRINVKMKTSTEETEINGNGAFISVEEQKELLQKLEKMKQGDYLVLSGSKPASIPFSFYKDIVEITQKKQVELIIDIPGVEIKQLLANQPFLIKPNEQELAEMIGRQITNQQEAIEGAKELIQIGVKNVIVSLGKKGAVFVNDKKVLQATPPKGTLISSVGAGDSLVAGFMASYVEHQDLIQAFQNGVAAGSATAYSRNLCTEEDVQNLMQQVIITEKKGD